MLKNIWSLFILVGTTTLFAQEIQVEPPFWWIGMENPKLQLMIHHPAIAKYEATSAHEGLHITSQHRLSSPNYLFVDVELTSDLEPGKYRISLKHLDESLEFAYELRARTPDSRQRLGFNNEDVIYLITPDRFANGDPDNDVVEGLQEGSGRDLEYGRHGGDIQGILDHLDYIENTGFTAVWLNPVLENDQPKWSYHGYATTDYYQVDPRFGSNEQYAELGAALEDRGMKFIMDMIANHIGDHHPWMEDPPSANWIHYYQQPYQNTNHRKAALHDPYAAPEDVDHMVKGWFVPQMPDLNQEDPFLATYLIQNSIWWIEFAHLAGIRQDTYSYPYRKFMADWTCAIREEYPDFNIVGEEWLPDPAMVSYWQEDKINYDGYSSCLPSLMDFPVNMVLANALNESEEWGKGLVNLYEILAMDFLYSHPEQLVIFPDNHDMSRIFTQVGEDLDLYKMALAYILTMRGVPQIYYGTEILMSNPGTESHGIIRSDFPGGWTGDTVNAFTQEGLTIDQMEAYSFLQNLLSWRKNVSAIHSGKLTHFVPKEKVYTYFRYDDQDLVMVLLNKNTEAYTLDLTRFAHYVQPGMQGMDIINRRSIELGSQLNLTPKSPVILHFKK